MAELDRVQFVIPLPAAPEDVPFFARLIMSGYRPAGGAVDVCLFFLVENESDKAMLLPGHILQGMTGIVYGDQAQVAHVNTEIQPAGKFRPQVLVDVKKKEV